MRLSVQLVGTAWILVILAVATSRALFAQGLERAPRGFELRSDVIVDPASSIVYVSHPQGGIEAIELASGQTVWHDRRAAVPLMLYGELLIAQTESTPEDSALGIAALDVTRPSLAFTARLELPAGARATIDDGLDHRFSISAGVVAGQVAIFWKDSRRPIQAMPGVEVADEARDLTGAALLDLEAEQLRPWIGPHLPFPNPRSPDLPPERRLAGLDGVQFSSADGAHVMVSRRVADDRVFDKHEWSLFTSADGGSIGQARQASSYTPFGVVGVYLLHETRPSLRRQDGDLVHQPLALRAVDLSRGVIVWKRAVRDGTYRGPLPP